MTAPDVTPLDTAALFAAVEAHVLGSGLFDQVNCVAAPNAPGNGLSATVWPQWIGPVPGGSGLATTSAKLIFNVRLYSSLVAETIDAVDPALIFAVSALIGAYTGNFQLGLSNVRCVDVLGMAGTPLTAQAGYMNQDSRIYRVYTITMAVLVNDCWGQHS